MTDALAQRESALASLRRHIDYALEGCRAGWGDWILWAEGDAYLADQLGLRRLSGALRGAAASPAEAAVGLLEEARARVGSA